MNISTEKVRQKNFSGAISNERMKYSQEYRVLATLRYIFPGEYEQMQHGDSPDLQDNIRKIGIEVVSAVKKDDMKASRAFAELKQDSNNIQKNIKKIKDSGYEITNHTNDITSISSGGGSDYEKTVFISALTSKCQKYDKYKRNFDIVGLSILIPETPTTEAEEHFVDWIKETISDSEQSFDFVYVISHRFCISYNLKTQKIIKRSISELENSSLCKIGRMTAEGELTLDSEEWK